MWRTYLADTMTGAVGAPIELPSFRWSLSVSDSSLQTTRDKGTGELDATGLQVPWTAVPAQTPEGRAQALASMRRSIVLCWEGADGREVPVVAGAIGSRTDTWTDTSFDLLSPMSILSSRYVVREGAVGAGTYSPDQYMKWQRTENPAGVTLKASCGIQVTSDSKVDKDGLWATITIGSDSKEWAIGGIHRAGVSEIWLRDGDAYMPRKAAQDSLKASCKIWVPTGETYKSNTDGHKKGDPKYETATATVSATVKTREDYEAGYKKWSQQAHGSVTMDDIMFTGSWRSIASQAVYMCTSAKPGGQLPIDLPYLHARSRAATSPAMRARTCSRASRTPQADRICSSGPISSIRAPDSASGSSAGLTMSRAWSRTGLSIPSRHTRRAALSATLALRTSGRR